VKLSSHETKVVMDGETFNIVQNSAFKKIVSLWGIEIQSTCKYLTWSYN